MRNNGTQKKRVGFSESSEKTNDPNMRITVIKGT